MNLVLATVRNMAAHFRESNGNIILPFPQCTQLKHDNGLRMSNYHYDTIPYNSARYHNLVFYSMYQSEYISSKDVGIPLLELVDILEQHKQLHSTTNAASNQFPKQRRPKTANATLATSRSRFHGNSKSNTFNLPTGSSQRRQSTKHHYNDKFITAATTRLHHNKTQRALIQKHKLIRKDLKSRPQTATIYKSGNKFKTITKNNLSKDFYYSQVLQRYEPLPSTLQRDHHEDYLEDLKKRETCYHQNMKKITDSKGLYRRAAAKWRMAQRKREKLSLDIRTGRNKKPELLDEFDAEMTVWLDKELGQQYDMTSNQNKDHKQYRNMNSWQNIDTLSKKQVSLTLNPLHSMEIVKCVVNGVTKQIIEQQKTDRKQKILHDDIKNLFDKQLQRNRTKANNLYQTYIPVNSNFVNNSPYSTSHINTEMFSFRQNPNMNSNSSLPARPATAIVVGPRIAQISKPVYRKNRLDRFGFDHPDLHNIVIPKTIAQLSECYEAVDVPDRDLISMTRSKSAITSSRLQRTNANSQKLGDWVQTELFNFEEKLKTQNNIPNHQQ